MFCTDDAAPPGFVMMRNTRSATPTRIKTLRTFTRPPVLARRELPDQYYRSAAWTETGTQAAYRTPSLTEGSRCVPDVGFSCAIAKTEGDRTVSWRHPFAPCRAVSPTDRMIMAATRKRSSAGMRRTLRR